MKKLCSRIQETLAELGPTAFQNKPTDQAHLAECDACYAFMEALGQLDQELAGFPNEEPSDHLINQTLMAVESSQKPEIATEPRAQANTTPGQGSPNSARNPFAILLTRFKESLGTAYGKKLPLLGGVAFSALLMLILIRPQSFFSERAVLDRIAPLGEPVPQLEENKAQDQLRKNLDPPPSEPSQEAVEEAFLEKQVTAEEFVEKIGLSRFFKKDAQKTNESAAGEDDGKNSNGGFLGGTEKKKTPLPDRDPSYSQGESNHQLEAKGEKPGKPNPAGGGRLRQDGVSGPVTSARKNGNRTSRVEKLTKKEETYRGETEEENKDLQDSSFRDKTSYPKSQTSSVATPNPVDSPTASRERSIQNDADMPMNHVDAEPVAVSEWEIGIPDGPEVDESNEIARVGEVAVTPPVFTKKVIPAYPKRAEKVRLQGYVILEAVFGADGVISEVKVLRGLGKGKYGFEEAAIAALKKYSYYPGTVHGKPAAVRLAVKIDFVWGQKASGTQPVEHTIQDPTAGERRLAERFLQDYQTTEDLKFLEASGYWANTYIPGDPYLKLLSKRLAAFDRSAMVAQVGGPLNLEGEAASYSQPFDPPENAALGLHLHTNLARITEPSRVILQVGLQGADRSGGMRSTMNLGLVLDLTGPLSKATLAKLGVLLDEFLAARESSDQFSLTVAGRPGGFILPSDQFRHGPLLLAKRSLLTENHQQETEGLTLQEAIRTAGAQVARGLDEAAPLGSSAIILITARSLDSLDQLLDPVHELAVAGIPTSAIGVGPKADLTQLDQLVLTGQGNRRIMSETGDAKRIVGKELNAVSRVIARAIRLRLRLASGVRLVEVLGSQKLDANRSQKVRQAEKSIDLHLGRSLGIQADRGEDEEGIQIVIPQFHGGDSHVILLDLWVPGPGKVADAQIRYKDLVYLRNGIARAHHSLSRHGLPQGPLQRQVTKNLIGYEISRSLSLGAQYLAKGQLREAAGTVNETQSLLKGLQVLLPSVMRDQEFQKDNRMLAQYAAVMERNRSADLPWRRHLSESLSYASYVKLLPGIGEE